MKIKEQIAVMQSFADGKEIEVRPVDTDDWLPVLTPVWNWSCFEYRVKPGQKLRPYTFEELQAEMAKGKIAVRRTDTVFNRILTITQVKDELDDYKNIEFSDWGWVSFEQFLSGYKWLDGSPCGVIEGGIIYGRQKKTIFS